MATTTQIFIICVVPFPNVLGSAGRTLMTRPWTSGGPVQYIGEIHGEPNLDTDPWARYVFASEQTEIESHAIAKRVFSPH
jgi:hypothetical protein